MKLEPCFELSPKGYRSLRMWLILGAFEKKKGNNENCKVLKMGRTRLKPTPEKPQNFFKRIKTSSKDLVPKEKEESHNTTHCNLRLYLRKFHHLRQEWDNCVICKWLHPVFGPGFTPYRLFPWYLQSKEILLNLSTNHWNSAFNAQGLRIIVLIVHIRALKI